MDSYRRPEQFLDELNRTRIIILHRFSEIKTVIFERERHLLKELDIIQNNFEIQLNIYKKRLQTNKECFASMEDIKIDSSFENIFPQLVVEERSNVENFLPMKKIQFRIPPSIFSTLEKLGSIKVVDENPNTRRKPTYGEERESHLFQLTRRKSKDDFEITQVKKTYILPVKPTFSAPILDRPRAKNEFHPVKKHLIKSKLTKMTFPSKNSSPSAL